MLKGLSVFILILVLLPNLSSVVYAIDGPDSVPVVAQTTEQQSRFLSAEAQRVIKDEFTAVKADLEAYQNENFQALDNEMRAVMATSQKQVVLGTLGAMFLGGGLIALIMFYIAKKYSYEKFLEGQLSNKNFEQGFATQDSELNNMYQDDGVQQMQQQDWGYPDANPTIGQDQGQTFASNNSEFSNWQGKAPHKDGWKWPGGNKK